MQLTEHEMSNWLESAVRNGFCVCVHDAFLQLQQKATYITAGTEELHIAEIDLHSQFSALRVSLAISEQHLLLYVGKVLGGSYDQVTPEISDATAEFLNIICGQLLMECNNKQIEGNRFSLSVPENKRIVSSSELRQSRRGQWNWTANTLSGQIHIGIEYYANAKPMLPFE